MKCMFMYEEEKRLYFAINNELQARSQPASNEALDQGRPPFGVSSLGGIGTVEI